MMIPLLSRSKSGLDDIVELLQETRAIPLFKRSRASRYVSHVAEIGREFSIRECATDGLFCENATFRVKNARSFLKAPSRKQNVGRNGDIVFFDMLHYPIICRINVSVDNYRLKQSVRRDSHWGVGYDVYLETVPKGYSKYFSLHRASVGIYVNSDQSASFRKYIGPQ
jgi:hypothetical protein